jgi:uncharacterized protein YigE (DUF2233 family)
VRDAAKPAEPDQAGEARKEAPAAPLPVEAPAEPLRATNTDVSGITFEGVAFDSRSHRLVVVDQERGPGSKYPDAASAAASMNGLAAVNGGFFTPEGTPLGLVVSEGKTSGSWNSASSLGGGIWCEDSSGRSTIRRREALGRSGAAGMRELLQAGPMLVENGRAVSGLDAVKTSARTLIAWDGGTRWWIGRTPPCSLVDLARALANGQPAGWTVKSALNLDGGRSADLWISGNVNGGPVSKRPMWNRPVRNFVVLAPR